MESENATVQQEPAAAGTVSLPAEDFGRKTLDEAETFADTILKRIRVKDAEGIKSDLTSLLSGAELLTSGKKDDRGLLATLPVVGKLFEASGIASPEAETLMKSIGVISGKLDAAQFGLIKDSATLETLAAKNKAIGASLAELLETGAEALNTARKAGTPLDFSRFETVLRGLSGIRDETERMAPQIRLIQENDRALAGKIQSIIFVLLPTWREVMQTEIELREDGGPHELNIDGKKPETYHEEALKEAYRKLIAGLGEAITLGSEAARLRELADIGLQQLKREIGYLVPKAAATAAPEVRQSPLPPAE